MTPAFKELKNGRQVGRQSIIRQKILFRCVQKAVREEKNISLYYKGFINERMFDSLDSKF